MSRSQWSSQVSRRERARWSPLVESGGAVCCRCGRPIRPNPAVPGQGWEPDHWPVPRELGGTETKPAHARCNRSAGGRRGAQITNARRAVRTIVPAARLRNIRGI